MRKVFLILGITLFFGTIVQAQQLPLYSQYLMNSFLLNPATAGSVSYIPVQLTIRQQWTGLEGSPRTRAVSSHALLKNEKVGVGGYIFTDKYGPISRTGVQASYSYHLPLYQIESKISLGLSVSAFQFQFDQRDLKLSDSYDPLITETVESKFMPDFCFGTYLYNNKYFVGLSAAQLFQLKINLGENTKENKLVRHYFLLGGYNFKINNDFDVEPSMLLKATKSVPMQVDVNVKAYYLKNYWLGVSYRTNDAFIVMLGLKYNQFFLGYAFDYTLSKISDYSSGSHEFTLGYQFKGSSRGSRLL